jgi:hypothetical protein
LKICSFSIFSLLIKQQYGNQITYTNKENDGVVLAESAGIPILTSVAKYPKVVKIKKTNHDQMKNSSETKQALKDLYEGKHGKLF